MNYELVCKVKSNKANILYNSMKPDMIVSTRAKSSVKKTRQGLILSVSSDDVASLRASANSFLRKIQLLNNTLKVID